MRKLLSSLSIVLLWATIALGQERTVTGTVTAQEDGLSLPGVSVKIRGSATGTQTGANGQYSIKIPGNNAVLVFSYIGFANQEVNVGDRDVVNVSLSADAQQLGEVVVTALGVRKEKRALTYATQTVDPAELVSSRETNIVNALAGKVAGVQINSSGGQAGSSARIVIRGNTSLTGNNQPLFVIDGIPMDNSNNRAVDPNTEDPLFNGYGGNRAIDLDPNIIENVTVLKGASATALYGSRGAFGVIQITTKKGLKSDRKYPNVAFSSSASFDNAYTDGYQTTYLQGLDGFYRNGLPLQLGGYAENGSAPQISGSWGPHKDKVSQAVITAVGMPQVIDPRKEFYRTGQTWNNSISISGGGEKSTYLLSYSNLDQEGIVNGNKFGRNSILGSFSTQLSQKVNSSTSVNYIASTNTRFSEGNGQRSYTYALNFQPISFDAKKAYEQYGNVAWTASNNFTTGFNNPYWLINNNSLPSLVDRIIASNETTLEFTPWLKLTNRIGLDTYTDEQRERVNIQTISVPQGRMYEGVIKRTQLNNDLILSGNKDFGDWALTALIGNNINDRRYASRTLRGEDLSVPGFYDITGTLSSKSFQFDERRRLVGLYGSASLDYKNYVFLNATARNDWSSTLPKGNNSFFYPSVSLGLVFTDALKMTDNKYLSFGKLRLSYAQAGNDAAPYLTNPVFIQSNPSDGTRGNINFPFRGINGFKASTLATNNTLKPEIVTEVEFGTDLRFFKSRLGVDLSFYNKKSEKQILQQEVASSSGFVERVVNAGSLSNRGVELIVTGSPIKSKNFNWNTQIIYGKNKFKLESLAEGVDNIFLAGFENPQIRIDKNYGYGVIWGLGFKRNEEGKLLVDDDGYPVIADDLGPIGNATPKWTGGLRNTFTFKGLSFSTLFDIREGGDILNMDLFYSTFYGTAKVTEQRNTEYLYEGIKESDGTPNTTPVMRDQSYWRNFYSSYDENFIEDGSFIKLREITLSYTIPSSLIKRTPFQSLGLSMTGRNLWIKSDFSFKDPEGNLLGDTNAQGFYHAVTPGTRGITFGLNAKF
ncbi:SusC/RagA family TonB-linked outer membrane protein [Pedobacter sp. P351]|uniref:SusC/RagA family TonB-linked outer membrane protein n=1 Tax=Pedobacter superstes TaxID=3133441 RepID=UPI0030A5C7C8